MLSQEIPLDSFKRKINKLSINLTIVNSVAHLTGSSRYEKFNNNKNEFSWMKFSVSIPVNTIFQIHLEQ